MTVGSLIKFNMPKLFSALQLIVLFAAGETRKNTARKETALKEALINNLTTNDCVLLRSGKKYSKERRDKNIIMKAIIGII
jgi:hypothetical protein